MKTSAATSMGQLTAITKSLGDKIYVQHNLLALAQANINEHGSTDFDTIGALTQAIDHANDDLFKLYEHLQELCNDEIDLQPTTTKTAEPESTPENRGLNDSSVIRMDEARSKRFHASLLGLCDANTSMVTACQHFPTPMCDPGTMEPRATVLAFTSYMESSLGRLLAMVNGEVEALTDEQKAVCNDY